MDSVSLRLGVILRFSSPVFVGICSSFPLRSTIHEEPDTEQTGQAFPSSCTAISAPMKRENGLSPGAASAPKPDGEYSAPTIRTAAAAPRFARWAMPAVARGPAAGNPPRGDSPSSPGLERLSVGADFMGRAVRSGR